jgi:hypothetical protein
VALSSKLRVLAISGAVLAGIVAPLAGTASAAQPAEVHLCDESSNAFPVLRFPDGVWSKAPDPNRCRVMKLKKAHQTFEVFIRRYGPDGRPLDMKLGSRRVEKDERVKVIVRGEFGLAQVKYERLS